MQDFIRIRGEVISSPLNENFRRLLNQISISNTNLIFPEENAVVDTVTDMLEIENPDDAQTCYVVSSGELYRYSKGDNKWHKIADFGQTFRQGFLNSGAVVLEDYIKLKEGSKTILTIPAMLVYFKNKPGDNRYLKGMYKIEAQELDVSTYISAAGSYSLYIDENQHYAVNPGMPTTDIPNQIFVGIFLTNAAKEVEREFIYTLPDIAYTADRGSFFINGGQVTGLSLTPGKGLTVNRNRGYYYDEGINFAIGQTENFPIDTDNGSNFDLRTFEAETPATNLYYITPEDGLNNGFEPRTDNTLVINKYWDTTAHELRDVTEGSYTIQNHLVTPSGQNIMVYGVAQYNSYEDAVSNLNTTVGIDIDFPFAEVTRVVVGNKPGFDSSQKEYCDFFVMERVSQLGTLKPEFADNVFTIYSGDAGDSVPSKIRFSLKELQKQTYDGTMTLFSKGPSETDYRFAMGEKFLTYSNGDMITAEQTKETPVDLAVDGAAGYYIPSEYYVNRLRQRIEDLEKEVWAIPNTQQEIHNQSIRYRLYDTERRMGLAETNITNAQRDISNLQKNKVDKTASVNDHTFADRANGQPAAIVLKTGDILEGTGINNKPTNLWYTEDRVNKNSHVSTAYDHSLLRGSGSTDDNPHGLSTLDITELGDKKFVSNAQLSKIDNAPANTNAELAKKLENITIQSVTNGKSTTLGEVKTLAVDTFGAKIKVDAANRIATLECVGQMNPEDYMTKENYAHASINDSSRFGYVDKAIQADNLTAVVDGGPNQYYGTNVAGEVGVYDLPKWVDTEDPENDLTADVESVMFQPVPHSVTLKHLANSKVLYTADNEENELNTNVYDLVKNHYHKVYNDAVQGAYSEDNKTPIEATVYYGYTIPSSGLKGQTYQFACGNDLYKFTGATTMTAGMVLQFSPADKKLVYGKLKNGTSYTVENPIAVTVTPITAAEVNEDAWLNFTTQTDWNKVNEWNFGTGLSVQVLNGRATINAVSPAGDGVRQFASLEDVAVTYEAKNVGKILQLDQEESGQYKIVLTSMPPLHLYMNRGDYAYDENRVIRAVDADHADKAATADKLQNTYTVNNAGTSDSTLWSAPQIKSNTSAQIKAEGVNTYSGTAVPANSLGKDGDLYILLED